MKYDKLLVSFNELQLEKKTVQEQAENERSQAKTLEARLKVRVKHADAVYKT